MEVRQKNKHVIASVAKQSRNTAKLIQKEPSLRKMKRQNTKTLFPPY
jgi:hypothetical protein